MKTSSYHFDLHKFFSNKGNMGPITEKAIKNHALKSAVSNLDNNQTKTVQRLHYFALGHSFKQINTKERFAFEYSSVEKEETPTKYLPLQATNFKGIYKPLKTLLTYIRNINSHYLHPFNGIETNNLNPYLLNFIIESYELALLETFEDISANNLPHKIEEIFNLKQESNNLKEVIERVLFFEIEEDTNYQKRILLKKGRYLSFEACLFLTTMFLYKNEANTLLSKIKGYKKNKGKLEENKRNIFLFYAKKFGSQDVDSTENSAVKFRDIIQYLNHYPVAWNKDLTSPTNSNSPTEMTQALKDYIFDVEIERNYPKFSNEPQFKTYVKAYFNNEEKTKGKAELLAAQNKTNSKQLAYYRALTNDPHIELFKKEIATNKTPIAFNYKEDKYKIFVKKQVLETYFKDKKGYQRFRKYKFNNRELVDFKQKLNTNENTLKLKKRFLENSLVSSYGRNQDKFLNFAMRFLAEQNYFGHNTTFKCYRFFHSLEQTEFLKTLEGTSNKKRRDQLKYHQGRIVHFTTFTNHLQNYPVWDMPFVNENNAVVLKIKLGTVEKIIPIQRKLMIYFLEDALYNPNANGLGLITNYYYESHQKDFVKLNQHLLNKETEEITNNKAAFKQLIPRKLINQHVPPKQNNLPQRNVFEKILDNVLEQEKKYAFLKNQAKELDLKINGKANKNDEKSTLLENFEKRNKGKRFKLSFIRKACNLMYFKDTYKQQVATNQHHKQYHITRDEFNHFCKWMYAFNNNDPYKQLLNHLFTNKGFYLNKEFKQLFTNSTSLEQLYEKVKEKYQNWLKSNKPYKNNTINYTINPENNTYNINTNMFYINVSHFIQFLAQKNIITQKESGQWNYTSLKNTSCLLEKFYYKKVLTPSEIKSCKKLHNKLKSNLLEDALLYQIALKYYNTHNTNSNISVKDLLNHHFTFTITTKNTPYTITVPFAKIDNYIAFTTQQKNTLNSNFKDVFLTDLQDYLVLNPVKKEHKTIKGNLAFEDLNLVQKQVINQSLQFSRCYMALESYYCYKDDAIFCDNNYIKNTEIPSLLPYEPLWKFNHQGSEINYRNNTYHFNYTLAKTTTKVLLEIEKKFITTELKFNPKSFEELNENQKNTCLIFLRELHNSQCYNHTTKDAKERHANAINTYFYKIIKQHLKTL